MTYLEAEKKLVQYFSGLLQMTPDREIFAGNFPEGILEGIHLNLHSGLPAGSGQLNTFTVLLGGQFKSRPVCREKAFEITSALPVFGHANLLSLRTDSDTPLVFSDGEPQGAGLYAFSLKLIVTFV